MLFCFFKKERFVWQREKDSKGKVLEKGRVKEKTVLICIVGLIFPEKEKTVYANTLNELREKRIRNNKTGKNFWYFLFGQQDYSRRIDRKV